MSHQASINSAYNLPFEVRYSSSRLLSSGVTVDVIARVKSSEKMGILAHVIDLFAGLAVSGALAGQELEPWNSGLQINQAYNGIRFRLTDCRVDDRAFIVLSHLLLSLQDAIHLESLEVSGLQEKAPLKLQCDPTVVSTYPGVYRDLPFSLIDEEPESGAYTFSAEMKEPLQAGHGEYLENMLKCWTEVLLAGGYGLAPIPPQNSYVEPAGESVTSFDRTVEWTIFKLRADPAAICGVVNIFAAFHHRCQEIMSLRIS